MSTRWQTTKDGTFEIVDRQGLVAKFFGGFMLFIASCFLYWLGKAVFEYFRFGTLRDVLVALPGMAVTLFMIALFGVPGILMAFLKKQTLCSKADGLIRQVKFFGVFRLVKVVKLSDVELVASTYKTTKSSKVKHAGGGIPVHTVEIVLAEKHRVEIAQLESWRAAVELGRQLAGYLGVEFRDGSNAG